MEKNIFTNPVFSGDYPDPSILKIGEDYYITHSSFDYLPGLLIWHSRDLVNWEPVGPALFENLGSVWAPELCFYKDRFYIYFAVNKDGRKNIYTVTAGNIGGPWSGPYSLDIDKIDPGHLTDNNYRRYLFLSEGYMVPLSEDGLSLTGPAAKIYNGWQYPENWDVEGFAQEGPKMIVKDGYYFMVLAEGGTAGPPTGHMVVVARSKNPEGPWENSPYNPLIRTESADEKWWSRGHGTVFTGPDKKWYIVYHAYENGFYNLGRQTLLEPVEWTDDGWLKINKNQVPSGPLSLENDGRKLFDYSDDFTKNKMGIQWRFYKEYDENRFKYTEEGLELICKGNAPKDSAPLALICGSHAYELEMEVEISRDARAGLILFYNSRAYAGFGFDRNHAILHRYGTERYYPMTMPEKLFIRLKNDRHIVTVHYSEDKKLWTKFHTQMEVSGYHHNVFYDFLSLRPAVYAAGSGKAVFKYFKYRSLP